LAQAFLDGSEAPFYLSTKINTSAQESKRKKISDEKGKEIFFDLKTVVFNFFFFPMFFYASWGCNGRKIEH
jgi:hypothetical protein